MFVLGLLFFSSANIAAEQSSIGLIHPSSEYIESQYSAHDPIVISSNQDFIDQGWAGNGSKTNPYLIQGLSITSNDTCISISFTNVYFKIIDCYFSNDIEQNYCIGVSLEEADNGVIEGCIFVNLLYGVYVSYSDNNIIAFNDIDSALYASINLYKSGECEVFNNSIRNIRNIGVNADEVIDCSFANNSFSNEFYGMTLDESVNCTLRNNKFEKGGLWIRGTERSHFLSHVFEYNTVGTKPISILTNRFSEIIDASSYGQLFLFNSSDCIVENAIFDYRSVGVSLAVCNDCMVRNLNSTYSQICLVELQNCFNIELAQCNIAESYNVGFRFLNTVNCSLIECDAGYSPSNTAFGIELYNDENTTIARNVFQASGVRCWGSTNCSIIDNNIKGNAAVQGIGIHLSSSNNCTIKENTLFELYTGFVSDFGSSNVTIFNNHIHDNQWFGIELRETCEGFRIYNNSFWYNDLANAIDNGILNYWDDGVSIGNQWDDYNGTGVYAIPGSAGSVDHFPRADPYHTRTITIITTTTSTTPGGTTTNDPMLLLILGISGVGAVVVVITIFIKKR